MISWIQRTFQHHFRIIFGVLLAVTIVSFIVTIGAGSGIGRPDRTVSDRDFFGHNLASQADVSQLERDAVLSIELQGLGSGIDEEQVKSYSLTRAAALYVADQLHLPPASPTEVQNLIRTLRAFAGPDGQFDVQRYDIFRNDPNSDPAEVLRVLGDEVRIEKVRALVGGPGYVLPADVTRMLAQGDTSWTIALATVDYASFHPAISATAADLAKYYQENQFRYQVPARVVATYVDFPASSYLAGLALTDAEVRAYYDADPTRFPAPAPAAPAKPAAPAIKPDPAAAFAAVRPQVEAALKLDRAKSRAAKDASDLAYALYQAKVPAGSAVDAFLAARHLTAKPLAPFSREAGPAELGSSPDLVDAVAKLSADHYYSEAVATPTGAAVLLWQADQPARQPLLAEVKDKVQADYLENTRRARFAELGRTLQSELTARLKSPLKFEAVVAAVAAANQVKIEAKSVPAFTLSDRPKDLPEAALGALDRLDQGQVSAMTTADDKGYLVYAVAKKTPDLSPANPQYAQMRAQLAGYMAQASAGEYLQQLVSQELKRTDPLAAK
jgi:peptidyl-prolyl cis-trans isomerase D